ARAAARAGGAPAAGAAVPGARQSNQRLAGHVTPPGPAAAPPTAELSRSGSEARGTRMPGGGRGGAVGALRWAAGGGGLGSVGWAGAGPSAGRLHRLRPQVLEHDAQVLGAGVADHVHEAGDLVVRQLAVGGEEDDLALASGQRRAQPAGEVGLLD